MTDFKKGHFVLVCGTIGISCKNVVSLSKAPWVAVCDFDFYGRDCGLLGMLEESIKKKRSLSLKTWCHAPTSFGEKSTQWWCLRGRRDEPDSIKASEASTHVHWFQRNETKTCPLSYRTIHAESLNVKSLQNDFKGNIETFCIDLGELCSEINLIFENDVQQATNAYLLPAADGAEIISLSEEDYAWLKQDLEILFLQNPYPVKEKISSEKETFFRGGSLPWHVWYLTEEYSMDVKRSSSDDVKKHIEKTYIQEFKRGIVTISHAPGSGGSTMAQRILWDLHKTAPCVQVRLRSGSPLEELAERLRSLCSKTHLPVVALIDGEDMPRLKQLSMLLQDTYVVILHVQRYPFLMSDRRKPDLTKSEFILRGTVTKPESSGLVAKFSKVCDEDQKKTKALNDLNMDVQEGIDHQMYEYGMTVFSHEFKGVRSYVKGYLQLEQNVGEMLPWQKCVGFLSLVFYYGHTSMPCQFFSRILGYEPDVKLDIDDLPSEMTVFVVPDTNEGRGQHIRIIHYIIAKEILEQILNRVDSPPESHGMSERLSYGAKRNLKKFCLDFISHTSSKNRKGSNSVTAQSIVSILTRTFIFRDNKYGDDTDEAETSMKKKGRDNFSQIVNDVDAHPPFTGRIEVVEKLCEAFPGDPNFRAHLGRIYSFCRPEQEKEIEKHFQIALKLCNDRKGQRKPTEIEDSLKLTLMHVYHMYGMVFVRRISKYVDKSSEVSTQKAPFDERLDEIIQNAVKACEYFELSRSYTQPGCEDTYTYIDEIRVRLKACAFIRSNFEGGLTAYLSSSSTDKNKKFVTDSVVEIEDLIMECHSVLDTSDMSMLYKMENWFRNLFMPCTSQLMAYVTDNDLNSLRLNIMVRKLNVTFSDNFMSVEHKMPPAQVNSLVKDLEIIICNKDMPKRRLEVTYLNWLSEIRNPNCKVYNLETVLEHVRNWRSTINSPKSTLYLFIIQSLIGFGSKTQPGNTECLTEALELLRGEILKKRNLMFRPKYPREWLGRLDIEGIRRLVPSKAVEYDTHRKIKDISRAKLATCKGTIRQKNDNKLAGYVDLDLHGNGSLVEVFYIPVRAGLEGSRYAGYRVQFHLAFTMEHGYEAFEVELLKKYQCHKCPLKVEIMRDEDEAKCRCGAWIAKSVYTEASDDS
ncbi:uncharacterized protein LOC112562472 [Pomacea canaliculata]|uniref:uncharacterized protein LOC112562472 n=1 Tax=Pomacea canaliculata TaxID=400727 RepID=UPI000D72A731|nr:uncharacterized protein LOC112562472 [Pomacea canaliculata]